MLTVNQIHVNYGSFEALAGISLEVNEGEIVALLGSNGAGKTTTINTCSGLLRPHSGNVTFMGEDLSQFKLHEISSLGLVQVPEGRKLFPEMSILENLLIGSYAKDARAKRKENLEMCFEMFPKLKDRANQAAGSLSGGERQMVFEIIEKINEMGTTIVLVEQNVQASLEIADRAYVIETGRNVLNGTAQELLSSEEVMKAYLGI